MPTARITPAPAASETPGVLRPWARVLSLTALIMVAQLAVAPRVALAHGHLKGSSPAAGAHLAEVPRLLRFDFSEVPELTFTSVRLLTADGREILLGALAYAADSRRSVVAAVAGAMDAGVYTVIWQMAGDDGHPVRGTFEFVVAPGAMGVGVMPSGVSPGSPRSAGGAGVVVPPPMDSMHHNVVSMPEGSGFGAESPLYVVIRWIQFVALLLVIGAVTFHAFVLAFIRRDPHSAGNADESSLLAAAGERAASIGHIAVGALAVTLLLRLWAQAYALHGAANVVDVRLLLPMVGKTMWGWGWLLQLAGVLLAGAGFHGAWTSARDARVRTAKAPRIAPQWWWRLAAIGAVVVAFSPALSGHAAASPTLRALAILADGLHVLGASSWLGTLAIVLFAGLAAARAHRAELHGPFVRDLINAFSPVALTSAGLAATTGVFAAWLHVGTIPNLWGTRYGVTLLIKLAILGVVALTGFYNWRFVKPRLGTAEATSRLTRSASVEVAVAILVLLVTAILVASPTSMDMVM